MPADRPNPRLSPLTVNVTPAIRAGLEKVADREVLSLSDVARRAFREEIARRDRAEADRDDAR
jgi:hypothetical protein